MATYSSVVARLSPVISAPSDLSYQHWRERLTRGYLAIKALCLRLNLPVGGEFFDECMKGFARGYCVAVKGSRARNVNVLAAAVIYRQSLQAGIPVPKTLLIEFLGGEKSLAPFHRVLGTLAKYTIHQDPRVVTGRLMSSILGKVCAPREVVEMASWIMEANPLAFLCTKLNVSAAAIVSAAVLATDHVNKVRLTRIATAAKVAPSSIARCLTNIAARLGQPLPDVPSKCGNIFHALFAAGRQDLHA